MSENSTSASDVRLCGHCGMYHGAVCPRIKAVEYHENGLVKRVEYFGPGDAQTVQPAWPWLAPNNQTQTR